MLNESLLNGLAGAGTVSSPTLRLQILPQEPPREEGLPRRHGGARGTALSDRVLSGMRRLLSVRPAALPKAKWLWENSRCFCPSTRNAL